MWCVCYWLWTGPGAESWWEGMNVVRVSQNDESFSKKLNLHQFLTNEYLRRIIPLFSLLFWYKENDAGLLNNNPDLQL